jgi:hypothetical protein
LQVRTHSPDEQAFELDFPTQLSSCRVFMFSFFRRKKAPASPDTCAENPGQGISLNTTFSNTERSWTESVNLVACLADLLESRGLSLKKHASWLELETGHQVMPRFESFSLQDEGGVKTCSTIETVHPNGIPQGVFEYQHAAGDSIRSSLEKGFAGWVDLDLPVLRDAVLEKPESCTMIHNPYLSPSGGPTRYRRVLMGPVMYMERGEVSRGEGEHEGYCPCCFFTNSIDSFKSMMEGEGFHAVRFFAMWQNGEANADCRVNGLDHDTGKEELIRYVGTWPKRDFEFRKQYVIIQNATALDE